MPDPTHPTAPRPPAAPRKPAAALPPRAAAPRAPSAAPPPRGAAGDTVAARVVALVGLLRERGVTVGSGQVVTALHALAAVDPTSRADARAALSAVLCASRDDLDTFAGCFSAIFGDEERVARPAPDPIGSLVLPRAAAPPTGGPPPDARPRPSELVPVPAAWSAIELEREKDFAAYTDAERAAVRAVLQQLARRGPRRRSRRTVPSRRRGHAPDLRRTVRASLRHAGEPLERHWRTPADRPRPLVLVADVSGSMAPYARVLLMYVQAAVAARRRVEAFALGTRLTRLTHELRGRDADAALARAAAAVSDWSGGTRIGEALAELNREHGRRLGRGAVVVILSDGWDRGDPELLAREMARLRRASHRVVWLNPLAAQPGYEPLARGMAAALPHTDRLLPGNSIASLEELAAILESL